jgi:hypothetical protein
MLAHADPERAKLLLELAEGDVRERWRLYCHMAEVYAPQAVEDGGVNAGGTSNG